MILTCPQCAERFKVDAELLAPKGRKVRCAKCKHTWHQLPDPAELDDATDTQDIEAELEKLTEQPAERSKGFTKDDIPRALRPDDGDEAESDSSHVRMSRKAIFSGALGVASALLVGGLVLFTAQENIVRVWPASYALYDALGIAAPIEGEGLVFEKMTAKLVKSEGDKIMLAIEGQIINLKSDSMTLPLIEASLRDEAGEVLHHWIITPPKNTIEAEAVMKLSAKAAFTKDKAVSVTLKFVAGGRSKTVSEDAGNTPTPLAGDNAHPSDPAKASESPAHADVPPHPESPPAHTESSDLHPEGSH